MVYYIFNSNNEKDIKFLETVYDFCYDNCFIPRENNHVVVGHSVMEIKQALVNVTNYHLRFSDGKYRPHLTNKENNVNVDSNKENLIAVKIPAYLPKSENINTSSDYESVITCIDNTWSPYMYKNNTERKNKLEDADIYLMSGRYLLGNPHDLQSLPKNSVKLSFGFVKDETLAKLIQDQINYISAGVDYSDVKYVKNKLSNRNRLMRAYKENYNALKRGVNIVKKVINKYNAKYKYYKVNYEIEPSRYYVYITSSDKDNIDKDNIKKFKNFYNKLNLEHKLYVSSSKQVKPELQSIWTPNVVNGAFIKN
jgi:hypothetical protein